ncbi:dihydrodipicolinate synthase family protein [Natranaeroarchaeum sulfidigenes]|uniref:Dihydrodipicolinate synthase/N-acetylneuraminatelyase n=1 Tax=Natranaeroarchaeum sulfidigenes TaxID=2784880 RepID=A0A897MM54_9EURY|nr:dihydrodipicolinate synthase family protein [Natranaeroarchaeum sulfidigenes]QSG01461.1 Dihydrodipicolinate synthase/N-acetylneuraminatelyase [Natranaeroarchaeum sulfidigenes]
MDVQPTGITCPLVTPFDPRSNTIDEDALEDLTDHVLESDIDGLFPCGTAGEFASLTPEERRLVSEIVVERTSSDTTVLVGAAATTISETVSYATHADKIGADAVVVTMPYFHTATDPEGNRQFFEAVADRSPLPVLLYNIPIYTGSVIELDTLVTIASHENIIGIKDSGGDFEYLSSILRRLPDDFVVLQGYDTLLTPALRIGADGGVNAGSNVVPETYATLYETAETDRGKEFQEAIFPFFNACTEYGFAPTVKTALEYLDVLPNATVRPPLRPPSEKGRERIKTSIDSLREH